MIWITIWFIGFFYTCGRVQSNLEKANEELDWQYGVYLFVFWAYVLGKLSKED